MEIGPVRVGESDGKEPKLVEAQTTWCELIGEIIANI